MTERPYTLASATLAVQALGWETLREGVRIRELHNAEGLRVALLSYAPGAHVPRHTHTGDEHIFVLEGSQSDERGEYEAGSYVFNPAGSHHAVFSRGGCLVLIHWRGPVAFMDGDADQGVSHGV